MKSSRLPSIRSRLTFSLLAISLTFSALTTGVTWLIVDHELDEFLIQELKESGAIIQHLILASETQGVGVQALNSHPGFQEEDQLAWQVVDSGFTQVLGRSRFAPDQPLFRHPSLTNNPTSDQRWNGLSLRFPNQDGRWLIVVQSNKEHQEAQRDAALFTLLSSLISSLLVSLLLGIWIRRELKPLINLSEKVRHYNPLDAQSNLGPVARAELSDIHHALNDMGDRLSKRILSEQTFLSHAAHALRTPLAGIDAQLAVAMREAQDLPIYTRLKKARNASHRLGQIMKALLALFRTGVEPQRQCIDLHTLLDTQAWPSLEFRISNHRTVDVDPDLFSAVLFNLFDNAQRHGAKSILIALSESESQILPDAQDDQGDGAKSWFRLSIHDDGEGCTPERLHELQQALNSPVNRRLSNGLGLVLAQLVLKAHGGRIELQAVESGFCIDLIWPHTPA